MELKIKGMHCKACDMLVKDILNDIDVKVLNSDHKTGLIEIEDTDVPKKTIKNALKEEGYDLE